MDEQQVGQLGIKMRDAYAEAANQRVVLSENDHEDGSRRLRKSGGLRRVHARQPSPAPAPPDGSFLARHPFASLLLATGVGYTLSRLTRH